MRIASSGNLTVELIRAERFDAASQTHAVKPDQHCHPCKDHATHPPSHHAQPKVDRVELSPQALASDPWTSDTKHVEAAHRLADETVQSTPPPEQPIEPEALSPVVGSPALAGMGAAWVVPGTLLDVLA